MVKKWMDAGTIYLKEMDLEDMATLKCCLLAMGTLVGLGIPTRRKKAARVLAGLAFGGTYIPLMVKFAEIVTRPEDKDEEE